jgi:hypothetical protein
MLVQWHYGLQDCTYTALKFPCQCYFSSILNLLLSNFDSTSFRQLKGKTISMMCTVVFAIRKPEEYNSIELHTKTTMSSVQTSDRVSLLFL